MITIKSKREIELMREAAHKLRHVFDGLKKMIAPGVRTMDLDREAERLIRKQGAAPAFKGYRGYPASVCASVNEEVVHAIPSERKLKKGDLLSLDMGLVWKDFYSDSARTWAVGEVDEAALKLVEVAKHALYIGMNEMQAGGRLGDISAAIQAYVESNGFGVVRDYVGHGIGRAMHEDPQVPNFGTRGKGAKLQSGMVLALEPMVTQGAWQVDVLNDGWTVVTRDRKLAAHYEDTIALTESGPENLTGEQHYSRNEKSVLIA